MKSRLNFSDREKSTMPIVLILLLIAAVLRTQPHVANVTPFFAISILVGFLLGPKRAVLAGVLAALAMFAGDLVIGLHWTMAFVYVGMAIAACFGALGSTAILNRKSWLGRIAVAFTVSGLASTTFFVVSNLGVWLVGGIYPRTMDGLVSCFVMAIPFFTNSLAADLFFGTAFVTLALRLKTVQNESMAKVAHGR
ncbi:hypothetical protein BH10BDE1_BH10BDE1_09050 [soil metagenome]